MPHLRLEYSSNVPAHLASRELMLHFHRILADHGVSIGNCKSRSERRETFVVGDGTRGEAFVHLDVSLLEGRTADERQSMGKALLRTLIETYGTLEPEPQITVEIRDMPRVSYFKHPPGTI